MPYFLARERGGKSPALRPSHPHGCRKRAFRQGQALPGRFAGLDVHALAYGLIYSRATDEEASGGGSVKGNSQVGSTKTKAQKSVSRLPQFPHISTRRTRYVQICLGVCSTEFPRYIRRGLSPGVQMSVPSCALCRPCLASDTDYTVCA